MWPLNVVECLGIRPKFVEGTNIGGAEKVGFFTHYHSYYFPVLLWATIAGYAAAYRLLSARRLTPALYAAVTLLVLFLALVDPTAAPKLSISTAYLKHHFVREFRREARRMLSPVRLFRVKTVSSVAVLKMSSEA